MTSPPLKPTGAADKTPETRSPTQLILLWCLWLVPPLVTLALVVTTIRHFKLNEVFFNHSAYYVLFAMSLTYVGVLVTGQDPARTPRQWLFENRFGIAVTFATCLVVFCAIAPAYRVLADEANLIGVSKNLFFQRTADFATTGKWYFENYWNLNQTIDRRPTLFPFLVSLVHTLRGYHPENGFYLNAVIFSLFVFSSYRLGKQLGGELLGVTAALLVGAHPNTLLAARSAGFDLLSSFMILIVIKSFVEYTDKSSPKRLAILALHLCILAHVRYEGWALLLVAGLVLLSFRMVRRSQIRGYEALYSLIPVFLAPRYWQAVAKAKDAEQPMSASLFTASNFIHNLAEYFNLIRKPFELGAVHSPWVIALALAGFAIFAWGLVKRHKSGALSNSDWRRLVFVAALLGLETVIAFSYVWGKSLHPAAARLFIWLDTFIAFSAAFTLVVLGRKLAPNLTLLGRKSGAPIAVLAAAMLFAMQVPAASEGRFTNALILTRQSARIWDYFAKLNNKNILILTDRPGLYTIMNYGALDLASARSSRDPLIELNRKLYSDVYLIQEVNLTSGKPTPDQDVWPDVQLETMLDFQNTESTSTRISRVKH